MMMFAEYCAYGIRMNSYVRYMYRIGPAQHSIAIAIAKKCTHLRHHQQISHRHPPAYNAGKSVQSNTIFALLADFVACYAVNEEVNKNVRFSRVTSLATKITIAHCGTCQADHCTALHRSSRTIGQGYFFNHNTTAELRAHYCNTMHARSVDGDGH